MTPVPFGNYTGSDGNTYTRYRFEVTNRADYDPRLFAATTEYGPCGKNPNPSRTWVHIYNGEISARIYGFCALGTPDNLDRLWFAMPLGSAPPSSIYITLIDRATNRVVKSNVLRTP
ncbi:MAG: hypothetical protein U9Q81_14395 [Pseudomonadota bacterium]|nr:hypothetical protein [Pseudomonadota bacterium]